MKKKLTKCIGKNKEEKNKADFSKLNFVDSRYIPLHRFKKEAAYSEIGYGSVSIELDKHTYKNISKICNDSTVELKTYLVSVIVQLIFKMTNQNDILLIVDGIDGLVDVESYTILRSHVNGNRSAKENNISIKKDLFNSMRDNRNKKLPVSEQSNSKYGDIMVSFHDKVADLHKLNANLVFHFNIKCKSISFSIVYRKCFYNEDLMKRLSVNTIYFLQNILLNPTSLLGNIEYIGNREKAKILHDFNDTRIKYENSKPIPYLIEEKVKENPLRIAYIYKDKTLSYEEFNSKSNYMAHILRQNGIVKGDFVPLLMNRGLELPIAEFAVMKIGAIFVPIDTNWPTYRIKMAIRKTNAKLVCVNSTANYKRRDFDGIKLIAVSCDRLKLKENIGETLCGTDNIYAIFTSGSTGEPKGAINKHIGITNRFMHMNRIYNCGEGDAILLADNHAFDASVWQLFWPIINGARTIIPAHDTKFNLDMLVTLIHKEKITITTFVPSLFNVMVDSISKNIYKKRYFGSLRQLILGGEEISPKYVYVFRRMFPRICITNWYGPSETSIGVVCYEVPVGTLKEIPIGRPISNVKILILDDNMHIVPIGIAGEIYIGGDCVGSGYIGDDDLTRKVFVKSPINIHGSEIFYKTGDIGRYSEGGDIYFCGRKDSQIQINGVRVEIGEIEAAIQSHKNIKESVVLVLSENSDMKICALITSESDCACDGIELRSYLSKKLPIYMLPMYYINLEKMPLNSSGKLDRAKLKELVLSHISECGEKCQTRVNVDETQMRLYSIWKKILCLKSDFSESTDFFSDLGGDSIKAIGVKAAIYYEFDLDISLYEIYEHSKFVELSNWIEGKMS